LVLGARDEAALAAVADGIDATAVGVDVRDEASVADFVETAAETLGAFDLVLANAGVYHGPAGKTPLPEESYERFDDHVAINARGVFATIKEAADYLAPNGRVLVPSGKPAREPTPGSGSYGVSKAAAEAVARGFSADLDQAVGVIDPGQVQTDLTEKETGRTPEDVAGLYVWAAREAPAETIDGSITGIKEWLRATR
jgi:NAD(P)-dependent dehydrogenase (short-subunit alcohol dehydrogenase family)